MIATSGDGPAQVRAPRARASSARARALCARTGLGLLLLAASALAPAACSRPVDDGGAPDVSVSVAVRPDPPAVGPAEVAVTLAGADGAPLAGAAVAVEGNMNHAGMTPVFAQLLQTAPGRYEGALEFTMGGDWFLLVRGTLADGREFERQVDVKGVRTP